MHPRSAPTSQPSLGRAATLASFLVAFVFVLAACSSDATIDAVSDTASPIPAATGGGTAADAGGEAAPDVTAEVLGATETAPSSTTTPSTTAPSTNTGDPVDTTASADAVSGPSSVTTTAQASILPVVSPTPPAPESPSNPVPAPTAPPTTGPVNPVPPPIGPIPDPADAVIAPITVTPSDDLVDGQIVTVASTEWLPNAGVYLVQCVGIAEETTSIDACDIGRFISTGSTTTGTWSTTMRLRRYVDLADGEHDCGVESCFVGAGSIFDDPLTIGRHPISFDADAPPVPRPTITLDPADGLRHRQPVTVRGEGFLAGAYVGASQCVVGTDACLYSDISARANDQGAFAIEVTLSRYVSNGTDLVDCLVVACDLRFTTDDLNPLPVPLEFDPTEPAPPRPDLTATPTTDLAADDEVTATLVGIESYWSLSLCAVDQPFACVYKTAGEQPVGADTLDVVVPVHRLLVPDGAGEPIDCAAEACQLSLTANTYGGVTANVPLSFAGGGSITLPQLSATPSADLVHGQTITVSTNPIGTNLGYFSIDQCLSDGGFNCLNVAELIDENRSSFWSDAILSTTAEVKRRVPRWDEATNTATLVDCLVAGCELRMRANGRPLGTVALSFDPAAPLPPDPSLAVRPSIGLRDGQAVTIDLDHLDGWVSIMQCPTDQPRSAYCRWIDAGDGNNSEQSGTKSLNRRVRRMLPNVDGLDAIDCAVSNARCSVFLFDRYDRLVDSVPLAFDPDVPLYPAPSLAVTPVDDLVDGQILEVTVDAIDFSYWVEQCATANSQRCEIVSGNRVQADGVTTTEVPVFRILQDGTDCATETCELRVQLDPNNAPYVSTVLRQPITFDPDAPFAPGPTLTVSPTTGLRDGDTVTVVGTGFRPGQVAPAYCGDPIPADRSITSMLWNCSLDSPGFLDVAVDGTFETTIVVRAEFDGRVETDCRDVNCYIAVARLRTFSLPVLLSEPLSFAPLEALTTEQRAFERVTLLTTSRINTAPPAAGQKVAAPAAPPPATPPTTTTATPRSGPPSNEPAPNEPAPNEPTPRVADVLRDRAVAY